MVNRFAARFRFALAFRSLELQGYSAETANGYSALTRASLFWTAFEQFKRALRIDDTREIVKLYPFDEHLAKIRALDSAPKFFRFLKNHLKVKTQEEEIQKFLKGESISPLVLAKSLRHIFLHGPLTPNAHGAIPSEVVLICELLCDYMLTVMDEEFDKRAKELFEELV